MLFFKSQTNYGSNYRKIGLKTNPSNYGWYECVHCHRHFRKGDIDIDHIIPQSKGGNNNPKNLQCLCKHCNRSKGNKTDRTAEDKKRRKKDYARYKRSEVIIPLIKKEKKEIRNLYLPQFSDSEILAMLKSSEYDIIKSDLKREAKKRGLLS